MLKAVVPFNIFVETMKTFFQDSLMTEQNSFEVENICSNIKVVTGTVDTFYASTLNKITTNIWTVVCKM